MTELRIIGLRGIPTVKAGDEITEVIMRATELQGLKLLDGDVIVVAQKIVSKAEGRLVNLDGIIASDSATRIGRSLGKDPRIVEAIFGETSRIVKMERGLIIVQTKLGFVCANAGIDQSNIPKGFISLLPLDPDQSAMLIRNNFRKRRGIDIAVIISDTFGRPWREGHIDVAVGAAGLEPMIDYRGYKDPYGHELKVTMTAVADELASAGELVMKKLNRIPVAIIRGWSHQRGEGSAQRLVRPLSNDLFI